MASNKELLRRFNDEAWNGHKPELVRNYCARDCVFEESGSPPVRGADGVERLLRGYLQAYPDLHCDIKAMTEDGPWVGMWFVVTGTHRGPLMGIPPTNRKISIDVVEMDRFENGKIVQTVATWNVAELSRQLGIDLSQLQSEEARPSV